MQVRSMQEALAEQVRGLGREEDDKFIKDVLFRRHAEEESLRCAPSCCSYCVCDGDAVLHGVTAVCGVKLPCAVGVDVCGRSLRRV